MKNLLGLTAAAAALLALPTAAAEAPPDAAELAKKLQNPVAALISVPLQSNVDFGAGPAGDGTQYKLNIQPVVPIGVGEDWNVIWRTILPVLSQDKWVDSGSQSGLGDTVLSLFLSPAAPTSSGWVWGVGPVFLLPTATDRLLGTEKWGAGPTAVVLRQESGWTYGVLANQIWSFAGSDARRSVNAAFIQPFLGYTTKTQTTFTINSESTYDWDAREWIAPVNLIVAQLLKVGRLPMQLQAGGRYYLDKPEGGPDWGLRLSLVFLLPK